MSKNTDQDPNAQKRGEVVDVIMKGCASVPIFTKLTDVINALDKEKDSLLGWQKMFLVVQDGGKSMVTLEEIAQQIMLHETSIVYIEHHILALTVNHPDRKGQHVDTNA